jgi:beta-lactamase superfamily II metal-dependent hydrolase
MPPKGIKLADHINRDPHSLTVIVVDAGQGDCILIVYPDDSLVLVDCGRSFGVEKHLTTETNEAIEQTIGRCLSNTTPVGHLKALVLTHPDWDHFSLLQSMVLPKVNSIDAVFYGGLPDQYTKFSVLKDWILNKKSLIADHEVKINNIDGLTARSTPLPKIAGKSHRHRNVPYPQRDEDETDVIVSHEPAWSGRNASTFSDIIPELSYVKFGVPSIEGRIIAANILPASPGLMTKSKLSHWKNTNSIVIALTYLDINFLLMGDATIETEEIIIKQDRLKDILTTKLQGGDARRHNAIKVGHHGSITSSSKEWIDYVKPEVAFISSDSHLFGSLKGEALSDSDKRSALPKKAVVERFLNSRYLVPVFPAPHREEGNHACLYFDEDDNRHRLWTTTDALFTNIHDVDFDDDQVEFTGYGTSWYYTVSWLGGSARIVYMTPTCGWDSIFPVQTVVPK